MLIGCPPSQRYEQDISHETQTLHWFKTLYFKKNQMLIGCPPKENRMSTFHVPKWIKMCPSYEPLSGHCINHTWCRPNALNTVAVWHETITDTVLSENTRNNVKSRPQDFAIYEQDWDSTFFTVWVLGGHPTNFHCFIWRVLQLSYCYVSSGIESKNNDKKTSVSTRVLTISTSHE